MDERIWRTVYRYGSLTAGHFGDLVLHRDGRVGRYRHPNEATHRITDDGLAFFDIEGGLTNTLAFSAGVNVFVSRKAGLYLLPVLEMAPLPPLPGASPALLINTIPKSGTYLLEAAAAQAGWSRTRLHLTAHFLDDFRGVADTEMHAAPERHRLAVQAGTVAQILLPGEVAVGHIDDHAQLDAVSEAGVRIVHCVRDLRSVLTSLYRFKRQVVRPLSPADEVWRALGEADGFLAFLSFFAERDIAHVARTAGCILGRGEPRLRFEELTNAADASTLQAQLTGWDEPAALGFASRIIEARGQPTPTLMTPADASPQLWSDAAERFFQDMGLARLNGELGYERQS